MRILILSWRDPKHPLSGGAEQSVWEHAKGWVVAKHDVVWFSSHISGLPEQEVLDGITIVRKGNQYLGVQFSAFIYYLKNKKNFDFVVDQFHGIPFFTPLYVNGPKLALIQEVARKVWFLNPLPFPLNYIVGLVGFLLEPLIFVIYKNTQFMTGSLSAKNDVMKMGTPANNITVIPHGVITLKTKKSYPKENIKTITYLGILSKDKGVEDIIKCFNILSNLDRYNFWVIGKGETKVYEEKLKGYVAKLGLKVKFWGYVSNDKKFELLAKSHLLINASTHEGWGLVNIEANSVGTPVVSYRSAGLVDSVSSGKSGVLVGNNTPEDLAETIIQILDDKKMYSKLKSSSISWAKIFDWNKSRRLSLSLISKVARNAK